MMQFYDYIGFQTLAKRSQTMRGWPLDAVYDHFAGVSSSANLQVQFEKNWIAIHRPYYDVYPSIIPMLTRLNLHFGGELVTPPQGLEHLVLRLPKCENKLRCCYETAQVRLDRMVVIETVVLSFQVFHNVPSIVIIVGNTSPPPLSNIGIRLPRNEKPLDELIEKTAKSDLFAETPLSYELVTDVIKLALTVCLIGNDPEFISREFLAKDSSKLVDASEEELGRLHDKAIRRGKFGFSLGKDMEMIPHMRRPHPALVWTGKGRLIPKIIMRAGSVVHREKVEQLPTGYLE